MKLKIDKLQELEKLGFDNRITTFIKVISWDLYIRIDTNDGCIEFYHENDYGEDIKIYDYVPQWAFLTIVDLINKGYIEE